MNTTTPKKVTDQIMRLCERILPASEPVYVPVRTHPGCEPGECFFNVRAAVEQAGGRMACGWAIWIWPGVMAEAEHHAVWELSDRTVIDVTPKADGEQSILFLHDDSAAFDFEKPRRRDNIRLALTLDAVIQEFIDASAAVDAFIGAHSVGREIRFEREEIAPIAERVRNAQHALLDACLKAFDSCTCGSGRQVRKCCGLERAKRPLPRQKPAGYRVT